MADILRLEALDFKTLFITVFVVLAAINGIIKVCGEFSKMAGKPFKWVRRQNAELEKIKLVEAKHGEIEKKLAEIKEQSIKHDQALEKQLNDLTKIVIDDRIDRMRYEILDMASAISESKRWYSVEQIRHTLKVYDEYEWFLQEHGLENGEVDLSIEIIQEAYKEKYARMKHETETN